ncbi:MAG: SDR family oxidoreductase [Pseudomonadales bacterium]|nr:SDR family oxidoreductase [Pseudomonadales bacterium]MCP5183562.1 SDR family oxidoreductase [Pseudomonadales bacterium]
MSLAGRHAVITGGGTGIGAAIAARLASEGVRLTLLGRRLAPLQECARVLVAQHNAAVDVHTLDVTDADAVDAAFSALSQPVDILVNNAGSAPSTPFHRLNADTWHATLAVNLHGAYYCSRAVIEGLRKRDYGRIVNIASTSALRGYAYVAAYCAAKHGLLGLTRALAVEYAGTALTVNAVCPGFTETDLLERSVANIVDKTGRSEAQARAALHADNPQQRFIQPDEIAGTVAWLLSDAARSVTGQAISISGGEV